MQIKLLLKACINTQIKFNDWQDKKVFSNCHLLNEKQRDY